MRRGSISPSSAISMSAGAKRLRVELAQRVGRSRARESPRVDRARDLRDLGGRRAVVRPPEARAPRARASARFRRAPRAGGRGRPRASPIRARPHTAATPTASAAPAGSPSASFGKSSASYFGTSVAVRQRAARDHRRARGARARRCPSRTRTAEAPRCGSARRPARRRRCAAGSRRGRPARRAAASPRASRPARAPGARSSTSRGVPCATRCTRPNVMLP